MSSHGVFISLSFCFTYFVCAYFLSIHIFIFTINSNRNSITNTIQEINISTGRNKYLCNLLRLTYKCVF